MFVFNRSFRTVFAAAFLLAALPALAQDEAAQTRRFSSLINFDALADNYARFLARKYDLNDEQDKFTQKLLRDKAHEFLAHHEPEVRELIDQVLSVRTGGQISQEDLVAWGKRAMPLYQEAKTIITESNTQWREILNENQRRIHDDDLKLMQQSFQTTEDQLQRVVAGQMTVEEFRNQQPNMNKPPRKPVPPPVAQTPPVSPAQSAGAGVPPSPPAVVVERHDAPPAPAAPPGTPNQPAAAAGGTAPPVVRMDTNPPAPPEGGNAEGEQPLQEPGTIVEAPAAPTPERPRNRETIAGRTTSGNNNNNNGLPTPPAGKDFESQWETYTKQFIDKYKLDESQTQVAYKILKECQEKGHRYMNSRQGDLERLDQKLEALRKTAAADKNKAQDLNTLNQQRTKLLEPITRIFEKELKPGLDKLPTPTQRKAAETPANKLNKTGAPAKPGIPAAPTPAKKKDGE